MGHSSDTAAECIQTQLGINTYTCKEHVSTRRRPLFIAPQNVTSDFNSYGPEYDIELNHGL